MKKKLVLKLGTSTLTAGTDRISRGKIEDVARQLLELRKEYDVVIISSGAIATARQFIAIDGWSKLVPSKQAMAAIGQPILMNIYAEVFRDFSLKMAQCLMTYRDFEDESSRENTKNTLHALLEHDYIPIVNENDTVAVEEILFGDNDKLSALVATLIEADLLVIASDIDGLFDKNPQLHQNAQLIEEVTTLEEVRAFVQEVPSQLGTGGMTSKLNAANICQKESVEMWILNGGNNRFLLDALAGNSAFTRFKF